MIAPRTRLLVLFAVVGWPAFAIATLVPGVAGLCLLVAGILALAVFADAIYSRDRLGVINVEAPEVVRFGKARAGAVALKISNDAERAMNLRFAPALPSEITTDADELHVHLPAKSAVVTQVNCTPTQRGSFPLGEIAVETSSRLGLWNVRRWLPVACELRVYPDLLADRQNLAAIFLRRENPGVRPMRRVGKGRDFEQLRDYIAGDSAEDIHWKATAKRGRPITKVFQVERTQEVYVLIDASRLSARLAGGVPMLEQFINTALIFCLGAGQQGDLFGLATFTDKVQSFVRAKNGKAHYDLCRDTLYRLQPARVTPDFDDLFTFLRLRLRRRALLVFLTALDDPVLAESFTDRVDLLARQHLVVVNMLRPPDAQPLFDGADVESVSQVYRRLGGHLVWHDLLELGNRLHQRGVRFSLADHSQLTADVIAQYMQIKQRQLI